MKIQKHLSLLACALLALSISCKKNNPSNGGETPEKVEDLGFAGTTYQLLVYSFADSDGDGIGDFNGIKNHLDYFESLGVSSLWLSPVHPCDSYHGYDVTDYNALNPNFGSEADFKALLDAANAKGIDVYLDYVLNHSGKGHPWFKDALSDEGSQYRDWYFISSNPSADVAAGKFASLTSSNSGEWTKISSPRTATGKFCISLDVSNADAPVISVSASSEAVTSGTSSWNVYYWNDAESKSVSFVENAGGSLSAVVDFTGYKGFLIRKFPNWDKGSKFGAPTGNTVVTPGTPMTLVPDGEDIKLLEPDNLYYHSCFSSWMPDINYGPASTAESSPAFKALAESADKWINMGVKGFRLDAVRHIYGGISAWDNAANQLFLKKWYERCNAAYADKTGARDKIFMVGEVFSEYNDSASPYVSYLAGLPSVFDFSFWWKLSYALNNGNGSSFTSSLLEQEKVFTSSRSDGIASLKLSNHDEDRTGEVLGKSAAREKQAAAILLTAQGKPFIYQGEELGYFGNKSRGDEYVRTPINWDGGAWADKSLSGKTDPVLKGSAYSVSAQTADDNSVLSVYRRFGMARSTHVALAKGKMSAFESTLPMTFAAWYMTSDDGEKLLVVHNLSAGEATVELQASLGNIVVSLGSVSVNGTSVSFGANSSAVFKQ